MGTVRPIQPNCHQRDYIFLLHSYNKIAPKLSQEIVIKLLPNVNFCPTKIFNLLQLHNFENLIIRRILFQTLLSYTAIALIIPLI